MKGIRPKLFPCGSKSRTSVGMTEPLIRESVTLNSDVRRFVAFCQLIHVHILPSVFLHCSLGIRKDIWHVVVPKDFLSCQLPAMTTMLKNLTKQGPRESSIQTLFNNRFLPLSSH